MDIFWRAIASLIASLPRFLNILPHRPSKETPSAHWLSSFWRVLLLDCADLSVQVSRAMAPKDYFL